MNSPSIFSDILDETENVCVEEESVNMEASGTFLNLLSCQQIAEQLTVKAAVSILFICLQTLAQFGYRRNPRTFDHSKLSRLATLRLNSFKHKRRCCNF